MPETGDSPGRLAGKTALVTGGSSGIGLAIARAFLAEGASVVITGRDRERLASAARQLGCRAIQADASRPEDVERATAEAAPFDILVNNAGTGVRARVTETSLADWERILAVNVGGAFLHAKAAFPVLRARGGGAIVHVASDVALVGDPAVGAYSVSKAALVMLSNMLALDGAPYGIRSSCVCPGDVKPGMRELGERWQDWPLPPLGRLGRAEDVAAAAVYLASDEASFVTGAVLVVDGGMRAGYGTGYQGGHAGG